MGSEKEEEKKPQIKEFSIPHCFSLLCFKKQTFRFQCFFQAIM